MAFNEKTAQRIREILLSKGADFTEKKCLVESALWSIIKCVAERTSTKKNGKKNICFAESGKKHMIKLWKKRMSYRWILPAEV